jgi:hypothetical protein
VTTKEKLPNRNCSHNLEETVGRIIARNFLLLLSIFPKPEKQRNSGNVICKRQGRQRSMEN